jgi:hypothetical protein
VLVFFLLLILSTLTPEQRVLRARMGAYALHSQGKTNTTAARRNSPQSLEYWSRRVDPDGALSHAERTRRSEQARKAHMAAMALKSSQARARRKQRGGAA